MRCIRKVLSIFKLNIHLDMKESSDKKHPVNLHQQGILFLVFTAKSAVNIFAISQGYLLKIPGQLH